MTGQGSGHEGGRALKTRVKTARKRSLSSTLWLERQLNDPFVSRAKLDGYRSRAAYKLIEIDDKYKLFKPGGRIVDLGAAPGGWSQIASERVKSRDGKGRVIGIDLLEIEPIAGVEFRVMDFHDEAAPAALREWLAGPADGVMSDMAANATGHRKTDHLRIVGLAELAVDFAVRGAGARRLLPRQGLAGRHGGRTADAHQARFRRRAPSEAEGEPRRQRGNVRARHRLPWP